MSPISGLGQNHPIPIESNLLKPLNSLDSSNPSLENISEMSDYDDDFFVFEETVESSVGSFSEDGSDIGNDTDFSNNTFSVHEVPPSESSDFVSFGHQPFGSTMSSSNIDSSDTTTTPEIINNTEIGNFSEPDSDSFSVHEMPHSEKSDILSEDFSDVRFGSESKFNSGIEHTSESDSEDFSVHERVLHNGQNIHLPADTRHPELDSSISSSDWFGGNDYGNYDLSDSSRYESDASSATESTAPADRDLDDLPNLNADAKTNDAHETMMKKVLGGIIHRKGKISGHAIRKAVSYNGMKRLAHFLTRGKAYSAESEAYHKTKEFFASSKLRLLSALTSMKDCQATECTLKLGTYAMYLNLYPGNTLDARVGLSSDPTVLLTNSSARSSSVDTLIRQLVDDSVRHPTAQDKNFMVKFLRANQPDESSDLKREIALQLLKTRCPKAEHLTAELSNTDVCLLTAEALNQNLPPDRIDSMIEERRKNLLVLQEALKPADTPDVPTELPQDPQEVIGEMRHLPPPTVELRQPNIIMV